MKLEDLQKIENARQPTPGMGLALDHNGVLPPTVLAPSPTDNYPLTYDSATNQGKWEQLAQSAISFDAWQAYTPTLTGSTGGSPALGNGTLEFRYVQIGKTIHVRGTFTVGSTTAFGTGTILLSLPVTAKDIVGIVGLGVAFDTSATAVTIGYVVLNSTTTLATVYSTAAVNGTPNAVVPTLPFTWATGDTLRVLTTYEAA